MRRAQRCTMLRAAPRRLALPVPLLAGLSPHFTSPFPLSFLLVFSPHTPQHLSRTTQPHVLETLQTQQLFQRQQRGPQSSNPPNQTQICSLYANIMYLEAGALLAHRANKQKHMAVPGRAITSAAAGSWGWWKALNQQRPKRINDT